MQNALAVYTTEPSLNGRELREIARKHEIQLRYMALGGYIATTRDEIETKALASVYAGSLLVIGVFANDSKALGEFDAYLLAGDREPIARLLNGDQLPWCEFYTAQFDYESTIQRKPKDKAKIDGSVHEEHLPALKAAKTRYIIYNQSRRKSGGELMKRLASALAHATNGIVANYQRPSR